MFIGQLGINSYTNNHAGWTHDKKKCKETLISQKYFTVTFLLNSNLPAEINILANQEVHISVEDLEN